MAYYIDLFSPETYEAFRRSSRDVSGFRLRQKSIAERINAGDIFVCYMTRLSRWFGVLEVIEGPYVDSAPVFVAEDDPFVVRFRVRPIAVLDPEKSIPFMTTISGRVCPSRAIWSLALRHGPEW
jgi:predicted RNA-binding protein